MKCLGVITGSGTYSLPGLAGREPETVETEFGPTEVTRGTIHGVEILHISRHGQGHARVSNQVNHRANIAALRDLNAEGIIAGTICGGLEQDRPIGQVLVFDDLHFLSNRLADGSICTLHSKPGDAQRGHWIFDAPFSAELRVALLAGAARVRIDARDGGCYGHVDGPRFNTRAEVRTLQAAGVTAISQTAGPEAVLAGEAELPYSLVGYVTDWANGVSASAVSIEDLASAMRASSPTLSAVLAAAIEDAARLRPAVVGNHYRFG